MTAVPTTENGLFISVDGLDCVGKTTAISLMEKALIAQGYDVLTIHGNWGDEFNSDLTKVIRGQYRQINHGTQVLLFLAMRLHMLKTHVLPALEQNKVVIVDRWNITTKMYQEKAGHLVDPISSMVGIDERLPDISFFITVPEDAYIARKQQRNDRDACVFEESVRLLYKEWTDIGKKAIADFYMSGCSIKTVSDNEGYDRPATWGTHEVTRVKPRFAALIENTGTLEDLEQELMGFIQSAMVSRVNDFTIGQARVFNEQPRLKKQHVLLTELLGYETKTMLLTGSKVVGPMPE